MPSDVKLRVVEVLRELLVNPHVGVPLVGPLKGLWRVRIGKYRVQSLQGKMFIRINGNP